MHKLALGLATNQYLHVFICDLEVKHIKVLGNSLSF